MGDFDDGANWSGDNVPQSFDSILIDNAGTAQVSVNASVDVSNVNIGGNSTLEIQGGILTDFSSNQVYVGVDGDGTLTAGAQATLGTGDFYVGNATNTTGVVVMNGAYLSPYTFYAGYAGNGTVTLVNGATLQSTVGYVGYLPGSQGVVNLNESTWIAEEESQPQNVSVGVQGQGEVSAVSSSISALNLTIATNAGATGSVALSGGNLTVSNSILVGDGGTGALNLSNSASATSDGLTVASLAGSTGSVSVNASTLSSTDDVFVGLLGNGTLQGTNAELHFPNLFIGRESDAVGAVTLSGGVVTITGDAHVAYLSFSTGTLTAENLYWTSGTLVFDLGPTQAASDYLEVGALQGLGTTYTFTFQDGGWLVGHTYQLISYVATDIALGNFTFINSGGFDGVFA